MNDEIPTTETPRTDAWATYNGVTGIEYVYANVARAMERELAALKAEIRNTSISESADNLK
jgi:hypothetical protein